MRYIVIDWDEIGIIVSNYRQAKQHKRWQEGHYSYCSKIKPYRGPFKAGTVMIQGVPQPDKWKIYEQPNEI